MRYIEQQKGFTIIELLIVLTIIGIFMMFAYTPFQHQNARQEIKMAPKIIEQTIEKTKRYIHAGRISSSKDFTSATPPIPSPNVDLGVRMTVWESLIEVIEFPIKNTLGENINISLNQLEFFPDSTTNIPQLDTVSVFGYNASDIETEDVDLNNVQIGTIETEDTTMYDALFLFFDAPYGDRKIVGLLPDGSITPLTNATITLEHTKNTTLTSQIIIQ